MEFRYLWRDAMASKDGPETYIRLALFALETFMDSNAECYPSTRLLAERSGYSRKSVERNLRLAEKAGWLEIIERSRTDGQGWRRHKYRGKIPTNLQKVESPALHVKAEGGVTMTPRLDDKVESPCPKVESPCPKGGVTMTPEPTIEPIKNQPIENIRRKSVAVVSKNGKIKTTPSRLLPSNFRSTS